MEIIAEKILEGSIASSRLDIDGMEEAGHISIPERIIQPLKRLKTHLKKIITFRDDLSIDGFVDETNSKMSTYIGNKCGSNGIAVAVSLSIFMRIGRMVRYKVWFSSLVYNSK